MKPFRTLALAAFAFALASSAAWAGDPTGTWKFQVETPNGRTVDTTLTLNLENGTLSGLIDNRAGPAEIKEAKFVNDDLSFKVVRKIRRQEVTTQYSGRLEGDTIKGSITASGRRKSTTLPWEAQRVK